VDGGSAGTGTPQVTALDPGSALAAQDDVLNTGGAITLTNANGATTFTATVGQRTPIWRSRSMQQPGSYRAMERGRPCLAADIDNQRADAVVRA